MKPRYEYEIFKSRDCYGNPIWLIYSGRPGSAKTWLDWYTNEADAKKAIELYQRPGWQCPTCKGFNVYYGTPIFSCEDCNREINPILTEAYRELERHKENRCQIPTSREQNLSHHTHGNP